MEWLKKLSNAIAYVEEHLDKEISYDEAARIACCSTFYFQRMFTYVTGISLADYIRRRRMTQAAFELQRTDKKVLDIALKYGYTSPTAFTRAFQNVHGITPAAAKHIGQTIHAYPPITFSINVTGDMPMSYYLEEKPAMRFVGVRTPLVEDMDEIHRHVPAFWNQTMQSKVSSRITRLMTTQAKQIYGISVYENREHFYYYIAAQSGATTPEGMAAYEIPAATWVVFRCDGQFKESVQCIFRRFYNEWLLFSGYEYAGLPDIEVYPVSDDSSAVGDCEVWIAVKKEKES